MSPGDRNEMGKGRCAHGFFQFRGYPAIVSEGDPGDKAAGVLRAGGEQRGKRGIDAVNDAGAQRATPACLEGRPGPAGTFPPPVRGGESALPKHALTRQGCAGNFRSDSRAGAAGKLHPVRASGGDLCGAQQRRAFFFSPRHSGGFRAGHDIGIQFHASPDCRDMRGREGEQPGDTGSTQRARHREDTQNHPACFPAPAGMRPGIPGYCPSCHDAQGSTEESEVRIPAQRRPRPAQGRGG